MKKYLLLTGIIFIYCILVSCSGSNKPDPEEAALDFINLWENQNFRAMHPLLTKETQELYSSETFMDINTKIYDDLDMNSLNIRVGTLEKETLKRAYNEGVITIPMQVSFDTIAGTIDFTENMQLSLQEWEDERKWYVNWNEGFILPGLENDGKVIIEKVEPRRGEIRDRNKMPLALNDVAFEIGVTPEKFIDEIKEKQRISDLLHMSVDKIDKHLQASWVQPDHFVPLSTISATQDEQLRQLQEIPSISYTETSGRTYPLGSAAAHLTGYTGTITQEELEDYPEGVYKDNDLIGKSGLEKIYEEQLRGKEGVQVSIVTKSETGSKEKTLIAEQPVQNGKHVRISIDVNIQEKIYQSYGGKPGTAAAIDPKTGEVLALVSSPAYSPEELAYGISNTRWEQLMNDKDKPFINRFTSTFAPGSSLKPITAAVGLANGTIDFDEAITINGLTWGKEDWGDFKVTRVSTSEKPVDLQDALKRSDNIYFAKKAVKMGNKRFIDGMKNFGFDAPLPLIFPVERSQISNNGKLDEIMLANTSYGQGEIEMSALHIALAYTIFLNEGDMIKPSFLFDDKKSVGWKKNLINKTQAEQMKTYLRDVVEKGTAKSANDNDLPISGKTGTVELKLSKESSGHQNGWFVGYPTDDEDVLIAMMMERVENDGSSSYVAGKVKDILKNIKNEKK